MSHLSLGAFLEVDVCHALIMNDNRIIGRAVEECLSDYGVDSFDHAWTEGQAVRAAARNAPDLVIAFDAIACGAPVERAQRIALWFDASVLTISLNQCHLQRRGDLASSQRQSFPLTEIGAAVALGRGRSAG